MNEEKNDTREALKALDEANRLNEEAEELDETDEFDEEAEELDETDEFDEEAEELDETDEFDEDVEELDETDEFDEDVEELDETDEIDEEAEEFDETDEFDEEAEEFDETDELDGETDEFDETDGIDGDLDLGAAVAAFAQIIDQAEKANAAEEEFDEEETAEDEEFDEEADDSYDEDDQNDEWDEEYDQSAQADADKTLSGKKALSLAAILVASLVVVFALVFTAVFRHNHNLKAVSDSSYDLLDEGVFVTDSDALSIEKMTYDVKGIGVLYEDAKVYDAVDGKVTGDLPGGTTLIIYEADGDYYRASDSEYTIAGYILKEKVNTGGLDIGNDNADLEIVDDETGEIVEVIPNEAKAAETTEKTTTTKKDAKTTTSKTTSTTSKDGKTTTTTKKTTTTTSSSSSTSGVNPEDFPVNSSPYFIYVEKGSHTITIYAKDSHGKYTTAVRTYLTATGRTASLTPVGLFSVGGKEQWHSWGGKSYSPYCSKYYGGLFFHGPLYNKKNFGTLVESSVSGIGTNASSGCMRTSAQAAYFIYAFCPSGTYVKIVNGSPLGKGASRPSISSQYIDPATNRVPVAGISIATGSKTVKVGESFNVNVTFEPSMASEQACYWVSNNPGVASVKSNNASCTVTAKAAGTAVITATSVDGSYKATLTVTVTEVTTTTTTTTTASTTTTTTTTTTSGTTTSTTAASNTSTTKPSETSTTSSTKATASSSTTTTTKAGSTTTTTTEPSSNTTTTTTTTAKPTTTTTTAAATTTTTTTTAAPTTTDADQ